jgi:diacylglycerol kinase (ATP)
MSRLLRSFYYALRGLKFAVKEQPNFQIHVVISIVVVASGFHFVITEAEWIAVLLAMGLVFSAELINTSIENLVDLVSPQRHPLAGKIKDIAAGAVLITGIVAGIIGIIVFGRYVFP